jgi:hypothetical protein
MYIKGNEIVVGGSVANDSETFFCPTITFLDEDMTMLYAYEVPMSFCQNTGFSYQVDMFWGTNE